ncbi:MAG: hypothetical protein M4579_005431 [Chaenotheca gracillima]|nr:MAG: hypothetical protein M4579_005431 [Chaenotheca gracillima]
MSRAVLGCQWRTSSSRRGLGAQSLGTRYSPASIVRLASASAGETSQQPQPSSRDVDAVGSESSPPRRTKSKSSRLTHRPIHNNVTPTQRKGDDQLSLPIRSIYPGSAFDPLSHPKDFLQQIPGIRWPHHPTVSQVSPSKNKTHFSYSCKVSALLPEHGVVSAVGHGVSEGQATTAAYRRLVLSLHRSGVLQKVLTRLSARANLQNGPARPSKLDLDEEEYQAKSEVYNYAAQFGLVPVFTTRPVSKGPPAEFEATVALPEQDIEVSARSDHRVRAEILASVKFSETAGKHRPGLGRRNAATQDSSSLTRHNAIRFLDFYKSENPAIDLKVTSKRLKSGYECQLVLDRLPVGRPVRLGQMSRAKEFARLTGAIALSQKDPTLLERSIASSKAGTNPSQSPQKSHLMRVGLETSVMMRETLYEARRTAANSPPETEDTEDAFSLSQETKAPIQAVPSVRDRQLLEQLERFSRDPSTAGLRREREALPVNQHRTQVLDLIQNHPYSIVVGATGSGKTTQVPQILFEDAIRHGTGSKCNIVCTQPRRMAATAVAHRVAQERNEPLQESVGYHVRFDRKLPPPHGSISFCTIAVLLQRLRYSPDTIFDNISHIVIDEVHERNLLTDMLMISLKTVLQERAAANKSTPKVILMSATIDPQIFARYFQTTDEGGSMVDCPSINIPGRVFPVTKTYLDDIIRTLGQHDPEILNTLELDPATREYLEVEDRFAQNATSSIEEPDLKKSPNATEENQGLASTPDGDLDTLKQGALAPNPKALVAATIAHVAHTTNDGAILVFLPGWNEIAEVEQLLRDPQSSGVNFLDTSKYRLYILHSSLPKGQLEVFKPVPPGCRKVILATNIAETSVTIPEVKHVIDIGKSRKEWYDPLERIKTMDNTWASKFNVQQRAGRAGRVDSGHYHALYTEERRNSMMTSEPPEILRINLQALCLDIKSQAFKQPIRDFLAAAIDPPPSKAVEAAITSLQHLGALADDERPTPLGRLLATLPVEPTLGKMIVLGIIFRCLDPMLTLGVAPSSRPLFMSKEHPVEAAAARQRFSEGTNSDHLATINAVKAMREAEDKPELPQNHKRQMHQFAQRNFIYYQTYSYMNSAIWQVEAILVRVGLIPPATQRRRHKVGPAILNENADNTSLIRALITLGLYPNLAINERSVAVRTATVPLALIQTHSVNSANNRKSLAAGPGRLLVYNDMISTTAGRPPAILQTTEVTPFMAALFGGKLERRGPELEMDGWLRLKVDGEAEALNTIVEFRKTLDQVLEKAFSRLARRRRIEDEADDGPPEAANYFFDDPDITAFTRGLVAVLETDARTGPDRLKKDVPPVNPSQDPFARPLSERESMWKWKFEL